MIPLRCGNMEWSFSQKILFIKFIKTLRNFYIDNLLY